MSIHTIYLRSYSPDLLVEIDLRPGTHAKIGASPQAEITLPLTGIPPFSCVIGRFQNGRLFFADLGGWIYPTNSRSRPTGSASLIPRKPPSQSPSPQDPPSRRNPDRPRPTIGRRSYCGLWIGRGDRGEPVRKIQDSDNGYPRDGSGLLSDSIQIVHHAGPMPVLRRDRCLETQPLAGHGMI